MYCGCERRGKLAPLVEARGGGEEVAVIADARLLPPRVEALKRPNLAGEPESAPCGDVLRACCSGVQAVSSGYERLPTRAHESRGQRARRARVESCESRSLGPLSTAQGDSSRATHKMLGLARACVVFTWRRRGPQGA